MEWDKKVESYFEWNKVRPEIRIFERKELKEEGKDKHHGEFFFLFGKGGNDFSANISKKSKESCGL